MITLNASATQFVPRLKGVLFLALVGMLIAVACGSDDSSAPSATSTPPAASTATVALTDPAPSATSFFDGGRGPVVGAIDAAGPGLLVDVRAAAHDGFDRIVFEFEDVLPRYVVDYVTRPVTACGSGLSLEVAGASILRVRFVPASAHTDAGQPTLPSQEFQPGLTSIVEAESSCDFEAEVTWVVGLTEEVDFAVTELDSPLRLVIDVAHP